MKPPASFHWGDNHPPIRLAHSSIKHELLRHYLRQYLNIVLNVPHRSSLRLTLFDGFAGGGKFEDSGSLISGTPLIFAEEAASAAEAKSRERGIEFMIDLWAAEIDPSNFESLSHAFQTSGFLDHFPGEVHLRNCSYEVALAQAVTKMAKVRGTTGRSIFLFDQTGFNSVNLDHLRAIFKYFQNPEVIMTFSVSWLVDLAREDPTFLKKVSSLGVKEAELRELLEAKNDWSPRYGGQKWVRQYISQYIGAEFDTCFFLKSRPANRDLWLLHFAKNWRARDAMMATHYEFSNQTHFYGQAGFEMLGYDPKVDQSQLKFDFTDENSELASISMLHDLPRSLRDKGGADGIPLLEVFLREMNNTPMTFNIFQRGVALARDNKLIEIYSQYGNLRPTARLLDRRDLIKIPSQKTFWDLLR